MSHRSTGKWAFTLLGCCLALLGISVFPAHGAVGDTTWVRTFDSDLYGWAEPHEQIFTFPEAGLLYSDVLLYYTITCPPAPNDCDPWDRLGYLQVVQDTDYYEIARVITPYDITGFDRPDTCVWVLDVSDYEPLLHGEVLLRNYIESWVGGDNGWLVTIDFAFVEGVPDRRPISITNLWQNYRVVYGDPDRPIDDHLYPIVNEIEPFTEEAKVRLIVTGHGQGNFSNCAEFCAKWHYVVANGHETQNRLWRFDCEENLCSPQGGNWDGNRAGWCPGDKVDPWDVEVTEYVTPGEPATIDYNIQDYVNRCRPNNPDCPNDPVCQYCEYDGQYHTEPIWAVQGQLIQYQTLTAAEVVVPDDLPERARPMILRPNSPNPFRPDTWIHYTLTEAGAVKISIHDAAGRLVHELTQEHAAPGRYKIRWDGKDHGEKPLPAGVYFYAVQMGEQIQTRKMQLLR